MWLWRKMNQKETLKRTTTDNRVPRRRRYSVQSQNFLQRQASSQHEFTVARNQRMLSASYSCLSRITVATTFLLAQFYHCVFYLCVCGEWWGDITYFFIHKCVRSQGTMSWSYREGWACHPGMPDFELEAVTEGDFGWSPLWRGLCILCTWKECMFEDQKARCGRNFNLLPQIHFLFFLGTVRVHSPSAFADNQPMSFHQENTSTSAVYCFWAKTFKRDVNPLHILFPFSVARRTCLRNGRATLERGLCPWIIVWTVLPGKGKTFIILESFSIWVYLFP